jgi:hypothetical protein
MRLWCSTKKTLANKAILKVKKDSDKSCQVYPGEKKTLATACIDVARKQTLTHTLKWSLCGKDSDKCEPKYSVRIDSDKNEETIC